MSAYIRTMSNKNDRIVDQEMYTLKILYLWYFCFIPRQWFLFWLEIIYIYIYNEEAYDTLTRRHPAASQHFYVNLPVSLSLYWHREYVWQKREREHYRQTWYKKKKQANCQAFLHSITVAICSRRKLSEWEEKKQKK